MREYETTFIARTDLSDEAVRQFADRIKSVIERHKGAILESQIMGRQNLAYEIKKQSKGNYAYFDYTGDTAVVAEVERSLRLDEGILKFLTVKSAEDVNVEARREEIRLRKERLAAAMAAPVTEEITRTIEEDARA